MCKSGGEREIREGKIHLQLHSKILTLTDQKQIGKYPDSQHPAQHN
jgi:hypothetical protein